MKKLTALLLAVILILPLFSCSKKYKPQESSALEASTVYTLSLDGKTYEVKYELYRALFLNFKSLIDGGDESVWTGENKAEYIERINDTVLTLATDIYAAFHLCEKIGVNLYNKSTEKKIEEFIKTSVEGGILDGESYAGTGNYEAYLAQLKANNMNYSVAVLMYRYSLATDAIDEYYIGTLSTGEVEDGFKSGAIEYTEEDVRAFYESDKCVRILRHYIQDGIYGDATEQYASTVRGYLLEAANEGDEVVADEIMGNSNLADITEADSIIARYNLDRAYFGEMTDAAFALELGEVSELIKIRDGFADGYYILYRAQKSEEHFTKRYSAIAYIYLRNRVGEALENIRASLAESAVPTDFFSGLNHAEISMD